MSSLIETNLFRITQEALNNIKHHSKAKNALIKIEFTDELLNITIKDDGIGFKMPNRLEELANVGKLGLIGMKQRIFYLNGNMLMSSQPDKGTTHNIEIKLG